MVADLRLLKWFFVFVGKIGLILYIEFGKNKICNIVDVVNICCVTFDHCSPFFRMFWRWTMVSGLHHRALDGLPVVFGDDECKNNFCKFTSEIYKIHDIYLYKEKKLVRS